MRNKVNFCIIFANVNLYIQFRSDAIKGEKICYYRLRESYRNASGKVCTFNLLNIGFECAFSSNQLRKIAKELTYGLQYRCQQTLFGEPLEELMPEERAKAEKYWQLMIEKKTINNLEK